MNRVAIAILYFATSALGGCSQSPDHAESHGSGGHSHTHAAPHGGHLIELGDHAASLEVVVATETGTLDLYVLDAHAEGYVRLPAPALTVTLKWEGAAEAINVELSAVANALTGETVGDSSRFSAIVPQLVGKTDIDLTIPKIEIGSAVYSGITAHVHP